ncbi:MAG: homoserine dehydrogenase, partial [Rhodobacteraceae bacterium]|nr:homoserine dehydrogenase [Paracoccaceae bacterium]
SDPNLDVGGIDAAHKLAILTSIAFGTTVHYAGIDREGIKRISIDDIEQARDMGYRIKLLCIARRTEAGIEQRTQPCLVPRESPLARVEGAMNIVAITADPVGQIVLQGPGAGGGPTGSAVVSDIADIARGRRVPAFGHRAQDLGPPSTAKCATPVPYYLRLLLVDRPGVLARVAGALGDAGISIDRMRQYRHENNTAPVIIVTHATGRDHLDAAMARISVPEISAAEPVYLRVEKG